MFIPRENPPLFYHADALEEAGLLQRLDERIVVEILGVGLLRVGKLCFVHVGELRLDRLGPHGEAHRPERTAAPSGSFAISAASCRAAATKSSSSPPAIPKSTARSTPFFPSRAQISI